MPQRNLLYTGGTRARKLVVIVGQKKVVAIAVRCPIAFEMKHSSWSLAYPKPSYPGAHGVRSSLLTRQAAALGLPLIRVELPHPCPNEAYEAQFVDACLRIKAQGIEHIVFGDLFLEDILTYRESLLACAGMQGVFLLWRRDTRSLAHEMIASGIVAHLVCVISNGSIGTMPGDCSTLVC